MVGMEIQITVKPGSKKGDLVEKTDEGLTVYLRAKAHDGEANESLIRVLAGHFCVAKSRVELVRGQKSRKKLIRVI